MDKTINAMAAFTDILKMQDVESSMDEIKKCCGDMEKSELQSIIYELLISTYVNCRLSVYQKVFQDAAIELDEKYDGQYQNVSSWWKNHCELG